MPAHRQSINSTIVINVSRKYFNIILCATTFRYQTDFTYVRYNSTAIDTDTYVRYNSTAIGTDTYVRYNSTAIGTDLFVLLSRLVLSYCFLHEYRTLVQ